MTPAERTALDALIAWRLATLNYLRACKAWEAAGMSDHPPDEANYWTALRVESDAEGAAQIAADAVIREREEAVSL